MLPKMSYPNLMLTLFYLIFPVLESRVPLGVELTIVLHR